ncbi:hypothetical protein [Mycobacterium montefiorense]|nr:hypothetical protein [Mycobacterium montefiorense]MCV7426386.1 hypothetical protein [Mycobacterium montefiorense]
MFRKRLHEGLDGWLDPEHSPLIVTTKQRLVLIVCTRADLGHFSAA